VDPCHRAWRSRTDQCVGEALVHRAICFEQNGIEIGGRAGGMVEGPDRRVAVTFVVIRDFLLGQLKDKDRATVAECRLSLVGVDMPTDPQSVPGCEEAAKRLTEAPATLPGQGLDAVDHHVHGQALRHDDKAEPVSRVRCRMRSRSRCVRRDRRRCARRIGLGHLGPPSRLPQLAERFDVAAELLDDQLEVTPPREARTAEDVVHRRVAEHATADAGGDLTNSGLARVQVQLVEPVEQHSHRTRRRRFSFELHDLPCCQPPFNPVSDRQLITSDTPDQAARTYPSEKRVRRSRDRQAGQSGGTWPKT